MTLAFALILVALFCGYVLAGLFAAKQFWRG